MKKVTIITALILAASLTGCGSTDSSSKSAASTTSSTASDTTENSTEASSEAASTKETTTEKATETTAEKTTEATTESTSEDGGEEYVWFDKGVYKATVDGNDAGYYIFRDTQSGSTADGVMGIGIGFACEQYEDSINFHKGSASESEIMTMSDGENGTIVGEIEGRTWVFTLLEGVSADDFDAVEYEAAQSSGQNPIMNFIGTYSNGRAMMEVGTSGSNGAAISISWGSSASETSTWEMSGECVVDGETITVSYTDCVRTDYVDGEGTVAYTDGTGSFTFGSDVKWKPDNEDYMDEYLTFTYVPVE